MPLQTPDLGSPAPHTLQLLRQITMCSLETVHLKLIMDSLAFWLRWILDPFTRSGATPESRVLSAAIGPTDHFFVECVWGPPAKLPFGTELVMLTSGEWVYNVCQNPEAQNDLRQQAT